MRPMVAVSMVGLEPIEGHERDYRDDDLMGRRLFVTGLPSSIDDVRLYLAFEGFGRIVEAHVAKPVCVLSFVGCPCLRAVLFACHFLRPMHTESRLTCHVQV